MAKTNAAHDLIRATPERSQHDPVEYGERMLFSQNGKVAEKTMGDRALTQNPMDRYRSKGHITDRQWAAGECLRLDWMAGGLEPRIIADLNRTGGGECTYGMPANERQAIARDDFRKALQAIGLRLCPVVIHVVCLDGTAGGWAAERGRKGRMGEIEAMTLLRLALDTLGDHYGLDRPERLG